MGQKTLSGHAVYESLQCRNQYKFMTGLSGPLCLPDS